MEIHKNLHIIYLSFYAFPGRSTHTIQIMNMCSAFSNIPGVKVTLITPKQSDKILDIVKPDMWSFYGISQTFTIKFTPDFFTLRNSQSFLLKLYRIVFTFFYALITVSKIKENFVIYSRTPRITIFFSSILKLLSDSNFKGYFLELHDLPKSSSPLKKAKGLIAISGVLKKDILKKLNTINEDKILVAHDGFKLNSKPITESISEIRKRLGLPLDKKIIAYTGRIIKGKGADKLIEAFSLLNDKDNLFLLMVGKVYDKYYTELAEKLNIKNIMFTGFVPPSDVRDYLHCSDILVLPSTEELPYAKYTSPLKLFEYMAAKKPIVASSLESIKEIIRHSENGLLFPPSDAISLSQSLNYLRTNLIVAESLAEQAAKDAAFYSWDIRAEKIYNFL